MSLKQRHQRTALVQHPLSGSHPFTGSLCGLLGAPGQEAMSLSRKEKSFPMVDSTVCNGRFGDEAASTRFANLYAQRASEAGAADEPQIRKARLPCTC